jgi:DNA-binding MarR family transcriptional regulator
MPPEQQRGVGGADSVFPQLAHLLSRAERSLTAHLAGVLHEEGCTVEQWRALVLLADNAGHSMSELAQFVLVPAPSLTRLIDRMVADNLLYRTPDVRDRRRVLVHITPRGLALHRRLAGRIEGEESLILTEGDGRDLAQLVGRLNGLFGRRV